MWYTRSITVSPLRHQAASTSEALARRSQAITCAPVSSRRSGHDRLAALQPDVGAHARQFLGVHEAVFEDRFGDDGDPLGLRHQRHVLRLQIGGEAGMLLGGDVDAAQLRRRTRTRSVPGAGSSLHAGLLQLGDQRAQMFRLAAGDRRSPRVIAPAIRKVPASMRSGIIGVLGAVQLVDALDANRRRCRRPRSARPSWSAEPPGPPLPARAPRSRCTVSPRASTAAIIRSSVPVTVMRSKCTVAPRSPSRRLGFDVAVRPGGSCAPSCSRPRRAD